MDTDRMSIQSSRLELGLIAFSRYAFMHMFFIYTFCAFCFAQKMDYLCIIKYVCSMQLQLISSLSRLYFKYCMALCKALDSLL